VGTSRSTAAGEVDRGIERRPSLNAQHRATYDRIAARYAVANAEMVPMVANAAARFLEELQEHPRILDLGCGHGRDLAWFAARGARVVGADLSYGMLVQARRQVDVPLLVLDMRRPAFRRAGFDGVWCNAAIIHLPVNDVLQTLVAITHLLVPGGLGFFSIQIGSGGRWEQESYGEAAARFFGRYRPGAFEALLSGAGFEVLDQSDSWAGPRRHWAHYLVRRGRAG